MFSWYILNVKPYIQLLLCVYGIYFAAKYIFQRVIKSQRGFSNAGAGAGYTFYPHSILALNPSTVSEETVSFVRPFQAAVVSIRIWMGVLKGIEPGSPAPSTDLR